MHFTPYCSRHFRHVRLIAKRTKHEGPFSHNGRLAPATERNEHQTTQRPKGANLEGACGVAERKKLGEACCNQHKIKQIPGAAEVSSKRASGCKLQKHLNSEYHCRTGFNSCQKAVEVVTVPIHWPVCCHACTVNEDEDDDDQLKVLQISTAA